MDKNKNNKSKIRSKISAIKKIVDEPNTGVDQLYDLTTKDLPSEDGIINRKVSDFKDKTKSKRTEYQDIFGELIKTVDGFLGNSKTDNIDTKQKPRTKNKLRKYSTDAAKIALQSGKQSVINAIKTNLFAGENACGTQNVMLVDEITLSPKEFDFFNLLTIDPDTSTGNILYETTDETGFVKMNREFFEMFDSAEVYQFKTLSGTTLFEVTWNASEQKYYVSGLQGMLEDVKIIDFLTDYYETIEYPNIENIIKQTMYMTLNGNDTDPTTITIGMDSVNRLLDKLFSACGQSNTNKPLNQTPINQYIDDDLEWYFDFDDTEGIDIDAEDARHRKVLKFRDCDNFEIPVESSYIEDFVYFIQKKNIEDNVVSTLNKIAMDAYEESEKTISLENLQMSLYLDYILNLPKSLVMAYLSPKIFFPITVLYKAITEIELSVNDLMKKLYKLFIDLIKNIFWKFLKEFWNFVKKDLLVLLQKLVAKILKNKLKRWKTILTALISLLLKLLNTNFDSCEAIYNTILTTIDAALNSKSSLPIPSVLLSFSDSLAGYSTDKAYMNIIERLANNGIPTEQLYGRDNDLTTIVKSIVEGHSQEMDENSYVKISLKSTVIPSGPGGAMISPLVSGVGKVF